MILRVGSIINCLFVDETNEAQRGQVTHCRQLAKVASRFEFRQIDS